MSTTPGTAMIRTTSREKRVALAPVEDRKETI